MSEASLLPTVAAYESRLPVHDFQASHLREESLEGWNTVPLQSSAPGPTVRQFRPSPGHIGARSLTSHEPVKLDKPRRESLPPTNIGAYASRRT